MKKSVLWLLLSLVLSVAHAQNLDSLRMKFADKVCACMGEVKDYGQVKPLLDKCYDKTYNFIFDGATPTEVKFYAKPGNLQLLTSGMEQLIKTRCPTIKKAVDQYSGSIDKAKASSFPTNFGPRELQAAITNPRDWNGKIVAFNAKVLEINSLGTNRPYLKVQVGDIDNLWVGSMANVESVKKGDEVRFVGYFSLVDRLSAREQLNKLGVDVLAFGAVLLKTSKLTYFSGAETQIRQWSNGEIPSNKR